ncbi:hypothetical protein A0J57_18680 [Sphingobium sp. 22B]|uniref:TonB-dependent receptor n=1 Tax=unclassified Sphingobium TaxID=2611147 RepID=UPI0007832805|nr:MULTISPECIES: TonB-dependent receptor [unclassified Sphingobium]KXU29469.1 hypothetical protein AXW74_22905 [Sphingobium sp. AM]KYC30862.1 hypothetical protein A0J57_18680 [Sphingobium sp. 22B]OAP32995.1 hypothetical protein A8O16_03655 [Sphingobium sp. 20006FA]
MAFCLGLSAQGAQAQGEPSPQIAAQGADENQSSGIDEIVVTAERRSESLQKSSLAIEVISGARLDSLTKPSDLTAITPGVVVGNYGPQPQVYIRGVGDQSANSRGQSGVAFNIDNVYYARSTAVGPSMFDIQRVEILKGPQGTLYGRNASGGAVNIITASPVLGRAEGYLGAEFGNLDNRRFNGAVNLPLGSTVALRVAGQIVDRDGYLSAGGNDEHSRAVRARLLWEPTERLSLLLNGDWSRINGVGGGFAILPSPNGNPWRDQLEKPLVWPFQFSSANIAPYGNPQKPMIDSKNRGVSLEANYDLGFATLTFIPAYRHQDHTGIYYAQDFLYAEHMISEQISAEARLGGEFGPAKWVAGAFYFDEDQDQVYSSARAIIQGAAYDSSRRSFAGFAQTTVSLTPALRAIAGGRYTEEKVTGGFAYGTGAVPFQPLITNTPRIPADPINSSKFNYKLGAEFDVAPQSMLFATYATGFKAGGFQPTFCGADVYEPEEIAAFTVGSRNRFIGNRLQINVEGFRWKYKDQQVAVVQRDACGNTGQYVRNPGDATIYGGNLDVTFHVTPTIALHGGLEFTHSEYDSFTFTQNGLGVYASGLGSRCSAAPVSGQPGFFSANCTGQELTRTPKWSGTAGYLHTIPVGRSELTLDLNAQFASKRWLDTSYTPNTRAPSYAVLNAEIRFSPPGRDWTISGYMTNITNEAVYTGGYAYNRAVAANGYPYVVAQIQPPRMYGIRLKYNFGEQ